MRSLRFLLPALATFCVAACDAGSRYWISVVQLGSTQPYVGDTALFSATEWRKPAVGPEEVNKQSDFNPELFTWSVRDTSLAEVIAPGRVLLKASGHSWVIVKTVHATDSITFHINR